MIYRFAGCDLDVTRHRLIVDGAERRIEPQVFDLLHLLARRSGVLVTREQLIEQIWGGRIISEAAVDARISAARRAVDDDGKHQRVIKTVPRRGIQLVCEVELIEAPDGDEPQRDFSAVSAEPPKRAASDPPASLLAAEPQQQEAADPAQVPDNDDLDLSLPKQPSIAILPFDKYGDIEEHVAFSEGLGRDITVRLARTRWLFVSARASATKFQVARSDPATIGARLGVRYLLHGALFTAGKRLRLSVTLTDVVNARAIWAESFQRPLDDIFALQDEITALVVEAVESEIELKERQRAMLLPIASLDAWSAYHRASSHLYRFRAEDFDIAEHFLNLAAKLDPQSARVFAGLSFLHWQRALLDLTPDREGALSRAFDFAHHSLSLDPRDAQGHWVLGRAYLLAHDFEQSVRELKTAVELNPNFANGQYSLAYGLQFEGSSAKGFPHVDKARRLSPYDPMTFAYFTAHAVMHGLTGNVEAAATWSSRAARQPNAHCHVLTIAAWCHQQAGQSEAAERYLRRLKESRPDYRREDFFRAFPYREAERSVIERSLVALRL